MQVKIVNGDIETLAATLNQAITDAYKQGQQAERERIKDIVVELLDQVDPWIHYSTLLEKIDE